MSGGKIIRVDTKVLDVPLKRKWRTSGYTAYSRPTLVVRLVTEEGVAGYGEASPSLVFNGCTPATQELVIRDALAALILGRSVFETEDLVEVMDRHCRSNGGAKSAIDQACWDAAGKLLNRPVNELLGGGGTQKIAQVGAMGSHDIEESLAIAESLVGSGYKSLKIKVAIDPEHEIRLIRAIREKLGYGFKLRIDANQGFGLEDALKFGEKLASCEMECFEQPLPYWDHKGMAFMRKRCSFPIMADESCGNLHDVINLIEWGAADIFNLKLVKMGGLRRGKQALDAVEAAGFSAVAGGFELGIGTAASLHFSSLSPAMKPANEHYVAPYFERDIIDPPHAFKEGVLHVPTGPGLGLGKILVDF